VAHTPIGSVIEHGTGVTAAERSAIIRPVSTLVTRSTDSSLKRTCFALPDPPRRLLQPHEPENYADQSEKSDKGDDCQYWSSLEFRIDPIPQQVVKSKNRGKNHDGNEEFQHWARLLRAR